MIRFYINNNFHSATDGTGLHHSWGCQESIFGDFQSHRHENKSIWVVFRVEFDGDICLFVAPPKSMFLIIFLDFFEVVHDFFVFLTFSWKDVTTFWLFSSTIPHSDGWSVLNVIIVIKQFLGRLLKWKSRKDEKSHWHQLSAWINNSEYEA